MSWHGVGFCLLAIGDWGDWVNPAELDKFRFECWLGSGNSVYGKY